MLERSFPAQRRPPGGKPYLKRLRPRQVQDDGGEEVGGVRRPRASSVNGEEEVRGPDCVMEERYTVRQPSEGKNVEMACTDPTTYGARAKNMNKSRHSLAFEKMANMGQAQHVARISAPQGLGSVCRL